VHTTSDHTNASCFQQHPELRQHKPTFQPKQPLVVSTKLTTIDASTEPVEQIPEKDQTPSATPSEPPWKTYAHTLLITKATISNTEALVTFDSASTHSIVSAAFLERAGLKLETHAGSQAIHGVCAAGIERHCTVKTAFYIKFKDCPAFHIPVTFLVSRLFKDKTDVLIGKDAHAYLEHVMNFQPSTVTNLISLTIDDTTYSFSARENAVKPLDGTSILNVVSKITNVAYTTSTDDDRSTDHPVSPRTAEVAKQIKSEFPDVFGDDPYEGRPWPHKFELALKEEPPRHAAMYRPRATDREIIHTKLTALLLKRVIARCYDPWILSPYFLVREGTAANPKYRLVFNYSYINSFCHPEPSLLPDLHDLLERLTAYKVFSTTDLSAAYHQIDVEPESQKYLAFEFNGAYYTFLKIPFGIVGAAHCLKRNIDTIFEGHEDLHDYVDDLTSGAPDEHTGETRIRAICATAREYAARLHSAKTLILQTRVPILGCIIEFRKIHCAPSKVLAIASFPRPTTVRELRSFLGMLNFLSRHLYNIAFHAAALFQLLKASERFLKEWTEHHEAAFLAIKESLTTPPTLTTPKADSSARFYLFVDASDIGLASVLLQEQEPGRLSLIAFHSRQFSEAENQRPIVVRELIGITTALKHYRNTIGWVPCNVYCDNQALVLTLEDDKEKPLTRRVFTAMELFQDMELTFFHVRGQDNEVADALSRSPALLNPRSNIFEIPPIEILKPLPPIVPFPAFPKLQAITKVSAVTVNASPFLDKIKDQYAYDPRCVRILKDLDVPSHPIKDRFHVENGLLFRQIVPNIRRALVIPVTDAHIHLEFLRLAHDAPAAGHGGFAATYAHLCDSVYWHHMRDYVKRYLASCERCLQSKHEHKNRAYPRSLPLTARPYAIVQVDLFSGIPKSTGGYDCVLALADLATRMVHFFPCHKSSTTRDLANIIFDEVCIGLGTGAFETIQSDRGSQFTSHLWKALMEHWGVDVTLSSVATPTSQSLVEASNNILAGFLRRATNETGSDWDLHLKLAAFAHNSTPNSTTKVSPLELLHGFAPRQPVQIGMEAVFPQGDPEDSDDRLKRLATLRRIALEAHAEHADDVALAQDSNVSPMLLQPGDKVFVHRSIFLPVHLRQETGSKLDFIYFGPVDVISTPSPNTAELAFHADFKGHPVVNIRFLKKYNQHADLIRPQPPRQNEMLDGNIGYLVSKILKHKRDNTGTYFFLTHWRHYPASARSWEPLEMFCQDNQVSNTVLRKFIARKKLPIDPNNVSPTSS
jgi:hypothetical protein